MARLQFTVTIEHPERALAEDICHSLGNLMQLVVENNDARGSTIAVSLPLWLSDRPMSRRPSPTSGGGENHGKPQDRKAGATEASQA